MDRTATIQEMGKIKRGEDERIYICNVVPIKVGNDYETGCRWHLLAGKKARKWAKDSPNDKTLRT